MTIPGVETASAPVLATLAESAIRGLVLALVVGVVLTLLRVRRTAWRLSAWTIVLFAALAMPALGRVIPAWRVPMANVGALAWLQPAVSADRPDASRPAREHGAPSSSLMSPAGLATSSTSVANSGSDNVNSRRASNATPRWPRLSVVLLCLYLAGMSILTIRATIGWMATRRLERAARRIEDADLLARLARISQGANCRCAPRLAESDRLHVPVTVSVVQPMVILPDTWRAWDTAMLEAVLAHEVAHVARRDALTQRAALLHRAIFWFSPLAWWLPRHLMDLAEQASDEAVLSAGTSQTYYARVLLEFFRALPQPGYRANWHVAMARGAAGNAEARVDRILAWKGGQTMRLTKSVVMGVLVAAAPVVVLTAAVRPAPVALDQQMPVIPAQPVLARVQPGLPSTQPAFTPAPSSPVPTQVPAALSAAGMTDTSVSVAPLPNIEAAPQTPAPPTAEQTPIPINFGAGVYRPGQGVSWPKVISESKPVYSDEARDAGINGAVELEIVVLPDGSVGPLRITRSLDRRYGLDSEAVRAARQWIFEPGQLAGQPVATLVGLILEFKLPEGTGAPKSGVTPARPRPLADPFATGAYFLTDSGMVAPQAAADRGQVAIEASLNPNGTIGQAQQVGLAAPRIIAQANPKYTPDGMRAKLQGQVEVEAIVMPDGTVGKVRVVQSLDKASGLDEAALLAAKQSRFTPGTLDGRPVPVLVTMRFDFRLH